ncbi:MAG: hypothetical protein WDO15_27535 [Bacteroidota bacterium]
MDSWCTLSGVILLDAILREWDKRESVNNLKKIIAHLYGDIKTLKSKLQDTVEMKKTISDYREDISTVMYGNLKRYIDQFSFGLDHLPVARKHEGYKGEVSSYQEGV